MYSVILGHLGNDAVAANSIVSVVRNLGSVLCFGIGSASGIIVGQILGENKIEEAKRVSRSHHTADQLNTSGHYSGKCNTCNPHFGYTKITEYKNKI